MGRKPKNSSSRKIQTSFTIDPEHDALLESFIDHHHISSRSAGINVIMATFFKEDLASKVQLPLRNSILIPREIYVEIKNLSPYSVELMIKNGELKTFKFLDSEYFAIQNTDIDTLTMRLEEMFPLQKKLSRINESLNTILGLFGIVNDSLKDIYSSFKENKNFNPLFEGAYLSFLTDMKAWMEKDAEFGAILQKEESKAILQKIGEKYTSETTLTILEPLVLHMQANFA